ncbi:hypothetical protein [Limosilactobacillus oris]|uniref:hypothetical protein n=1 Tax=Limosilactobacillus oris TaxID=1632 RepID=UPI00195A0893|nr:hypothetical protein [Limosilactobacillus oris]VTX69739.1 Uncharacterised protein [Limosilactobacillus oris]
MNQRLSETIANKIRNMKDEHVADWKIGEYLSSNKDEFERELQEAEITKSEWLKKYDFSETWVRKINNEFKLVKTLKRDETYRELIPKFEQLPSKAREKASQPSTTFDMALRIINRDWQSSREFDRWYHSQTREASTISENNSIPEEANDSSQLFDEENGSQVVVPEALAETYRNMPSAERDIFLSFEREWVHTKRDFLIRVGNVLRQVKNHVQCQGARSDLHGGMTFDKWTRAHGIARSTAYMAMDVANGYFKIKAENDPDEELALQNFLSLPRRVQVAIGKGKVDSEKTKYLLHTPEKVRNSTVWQEMVKSIDEKKKADSEQKEKIQQLKAKNQELTSRLAAVESSRAEVFNQLDQERRDKHHIQLELDNERNKPPRSVEVPPADYDELKAELAAVEAESADKGRQIQQLSEKLQAAKDNLLSQDDVKKYQEEIDTLKKQNEKLAYQSKNLQDELNSKKDKYQQHQEAFSRVTKRSSELLAEVISNFDLLKMVPDIKHLSREEIAKTDLFNLSDALIDKGNVIREHLVSSSIDGDVIEGDFAERSKE